MRAIIESLSEYGSGWGWDYNTYSFDQEYQKTSYDSYSNLQVEISPYMYKDDGITLTNCLDNMDNTDGDRLYSDSIMHHQISCKPNVRNAGNWYTWFGAAADSQIEKGTENNSICPKGWRLVMDEILEEDKSYWALIVIVYDIRETNNDNEILLSPLSFIRSGRYYRGNITGRSTDGFFWSSATITIHNAYALDFTSNRLNPRNDYGFGDNKRNGYSVRCVSR